MKVLFITNIPSPYRVEFFKQLGKECELTVLFEKASSDERDTSWNNYNFDGFKGIIMKGIKFTVDGAFCPGVIKYLNAKKFDKIIVTDVSSPTGMLAIQYMRMRGIPYYIEGDGGFAKSGKGFKENIKRYFIKGAKGYFSTSKSHDEYYLTYGAKEEKIYRYPFSSLKEEDIITTPASEEEKQNLRKELNITEKHCILAVGQFVHRKGFDVLLNSAKMLSNDIGIYLVGGEPIEEYLSFIKENGLENIHFICFKNKPELKKYYLACDVFVHPTRDDIWGLVINEAMACGCPVITTEKCIAGLELIKNDLNGYLVPTDEPGAIADGVNKILENEALKAQMSLNNLEKIKDYTIEKMVQRHITILNEA